MSGLNLQVSRRFCSPQHIANYASVKSLMERVNSVNTMRVRIPSGSRVLYLLASALSVNSLVVPINIGHHAL